MVEEVLGGEDMMKILMRNEAIVTTYWLGYYFFIS